MKKLLSIITLLLTVCSGAWGEAYTSTDPKTITFDGTYGNKTFLDVTGTNSNATIESSGETCLAYNVLYLESLETKPNWFTPSTKGSNSSSAAYTDAENYGFLTTTNASSKDVTTNSKGYGNVTVYNLIDGNVLAFNVTGITGVSVLGKDNGTSSNKQFSINIKEVASDGSLSNVGETASTGNTSFHIVSYDGNATGNTTLDASKYYIVTIYAKTKNSNYIAQISFTQQSGPTITSQTMADANYVEGTAAEDVTALSVSATGTGTLYYQWFSNTTKSTEGAVSVQAKSSETGANTYKPSAESEGIKYYYCAVTDDNATANSSFAKITVSAASAPSAISISGDASAARGADAITLTADVTGGVPDPNIEWFACDDDQKTNAVSQGAASTSNTTFDVATTTVGTYYYYAVATNATGSVASAVKTITIVPQAPTLTAGGYFSGDSKSVEIAKATGEDAAAVIKYSTDNGESWSDYSEALSLTATTTVKAKVVQSGLESAEVSATYTKFTPSTITEVNAITTWDWTGWDQTLELKNDGTTNPSSTDDYTFDDIAAINGGFTVPASFNGAAMKFKGQYPVRSKKSQAGYWTIKPSVNGTITVTFSDTGSSIQTGYTTETQPKRYLNINGTNTDYYTKRTGSSTDKKTVTVPVSAGEVVITGMDEDGETWQAIVVEKIIFTPTATVTTNKGGWTSFTPSWNATLEDGATAYIITSIDGANYSVEATAVSVMESGKGYFIKGDNAETEYIVTATSTAATPTEGNLIVGNTSATTINATSPTTTDKYVLGTATAGTYSGQSGLFKVDSSVNVAAGKAYLDTQTTVSAQYLSIAWDDDMTTTIDNFTISQFDKNATRYNLAGQKVSDSYKGIVIVNGKKYLCK